MQWNSAAWIRGGVELNCCGEVGLRYARQGKGIDKIRGVRQGLGGEMSRAAKAEMGPDKQGRGHEAHNITPLRKGTDYQSIGIAKK